MRDRERVKEKERVRERMREREANYFEIDRLSQSHCAGMIMIQYKL